LRGGSTTASRELGATLDHRDGHEYKHFMNALLAPDRSHRGRRAVSMLALLVLVPALYSVSPLMLFIVAAVWTSSAVVTLGLNALREAHVEESTTCSSDVERLSGSREPTIL
jgi:hypothetical protein